jgi:hypothetical protein
MLQFFAKIQLQEQELIFLKEIERQIASHSDSQHLHSYTALQIFF